MIRLLSLLIALPLLGLAHITPRRVKRHVRSRWPKSARNPRHLVGWEPRPAEVTVRLDELMGGGDR